MMEVTINKKFSIRKKRTFLAKHLRLVFLVTNMPHLVYKANALTHQSSIDIMTGSKTDLMQAKNTLPISNEATQSIYVDNDDDTVNTSPSFNNANTQPDLKRNLREVMSDNYEEYISKDKKQVGEEYKSLEYKNVITTSYKSTSTNSSITKDQNRYNNIILNLCIYRTKYPYKLLLMFDYFYLILVTLQRKLMFVQKI